jgi:hypothetical protein
MADYSCDWCDKVSECKYSYEDTDCIPAKYIDIATKITKAEITQYKFAVKDFEDRDEDLFYPILSGYRQIINEYPDDDELIYAKSLLDKRL